MVARGQVDGSAIDSQVHSIELREHPDLVEQVRVVEALGPSTIQPVAVSGRVPEDVQEAIRDVLVALADDPALRQRLGVALVERFCARERKVVRRDPDDGERLRGARFMELRCSGAPAGLPWCPYSRRPIH